MGLFDFFKDGDDYQGNHSRKINKARFDALKIETTTDLIHWLEKNKVILLSEKDGIVVYSNDQKQNFLQVYTDSKEVTDENLEEYVEVSAGDIRDLLEEMSYILYLVLNPSSDNFIITREEMLDKKETQVDDKAVSSQVATVPLEFEVTSEPVVEEETFESERFGDETKIFTLNDNEEGIKDDLDSESEAISSSTEVSEIISELEEAEKNKEVSRVSTEQTRKGEKMAKFEAVSKVSQKVISAVLEYSIAGANSFYMAIESSSQRPYLLVDTTDYVEIQESDEFATITRNDEMAAELSEAQFLIYDTAASKEMLGNYSDTTVISFLKTNPIIYTLPESENGEATELSSFTDFSQIPELFLEAFDEFEIAHSTEFNDFLANSSELEIVQVNPFTKALFLKPEAFKSQEIVVPKVEASTQISIEVNKGKDSLISILTILKKFKLKNIEISDAEDQFTISFASEKDLVIARQILKLKTGYVIK
ncbi:MAG: hypothetical protein LBI13_09500 [Streptococcaceae bacterium]|jgi:hypothetical protein|nr:hypothetical protein [Streptococcaceae bacterium]